MDPQTFTSLMTQLNAKPFASDKKSVLKTFMQQHCFSAEQAAQVIEKFSHSSDKTETLSLIAPRLVVLSGAGGKTIVSAFTFAGDKLKAVEIIASHVNDPAGKYTILEAIDFHFDKEKARKILDEAKPLAAPQPTCCTSYQQGFAPPSQYPPQAVTYQPPPQAAPYQSPLQAAQYLASVQAASMQACIDATQHPPPQAAQYPPPQAAQYPPPPAQGTPYGQPPPAQGTPYGQPPPAQATPYGQLPPYTYPPPQQGAPTGTGYPLYGGFQGYPPNTCI